MFTFIAGFATYVQFLGVDHVFPESNYRARQLVMAQQVVFQIDALESSNAITMEVSNPNYDLHFGAIAYKKGIKLES